MKKRRDIILVFVCLALAACTGAPPEAVPTAEATEIVLAEETAQPATSTTEPTAEPPEITPNPDDLPQDTATTEPPTATASPTVIPPSATPTSSPTATIEPFDPNSAYGSPTLLDNLAGDSNWADGSGNLPDTSYIRMVLGSNQLLVTGKLAQFDTWWFTYSTAGNQFIQIQVETESCSGKQAYGLILRGPASITSAHGYILAFSCDGAYRLIRLDSSNPYTFVELIPWTTSGAINAGSDESNTMGVRLVGDAITIFANGLGIDAVEDDKFSAGRFGLFVNAGTLGNFTFLLNQLAFWNLD